MLKKFAIGAAFALTTALAAASSATAATTAVAVANVNLRAGPSTTYPAVTIVPSGTAITTYGCTPGYGWCDIGFGPYRGWVAANYIQVVYRGTPVVLTAPVAPAVGITVVTFNRVYWDTYYRAYPWYGRWATYPVPVYRPYPAARVTSVNRNVACAGGACVGTRGATGVYGGSTAQARACSGGSCTSTRVTHGPNGGIGARTRSCTAGQGCTTNRAAIGPGGGVYAGSRSFPR